MFDTMLDFVAKAAVTAFRVEGRYFYEDRSSGTRIPLSDVAETDIEIVEQDHENGMITAIRKGKRFLVPRPTIEAVDAWRKSLGVDLMKKPTPHGGDFIIKEADDIFERFEITKRETYSTLGPNKALYQVNSVFINE